MKRQRSKFRKTVIFDANSPLPKEMSEKFDPGVLIHFLLGKYRQPKEEERVFLFMDLKGSTPVAEKLGHVRYSQFIQACFADLTESVSRHQAEIYQYVGDEVVLTWRMETGLAGANCVETYFHFRQTLTRRANDYLKTYGVVPEFKAGLHMGRVTVAEVGILKRDIAFHGDVVNTASRIQSKGNAFGKPLLLSASLAGRLGQHGDFGVEAIGTVTLRRKATGVNLYSLEKRE